MLLVQLQNDTARRGHAVISDWLDPPGVVVVHLCVSTAGRIGEIRVWAMGFILFLFVNIFFYIFRFLALWSIFVCSLARLEPLYLMRYGLGRVFLGYRKLLRRGRFSRLGELGVCHAPEVLGGWPIKGGYISSMLHSWMKSIELIQTC